MSEHAEETELLWEEFRDRMLSYIRRRVDEIYDAEDILQEVFLRVHANADRLPKVDNIAAWIYRIAANAIVDHGRRKTRDTDMINRFAKTEGNEADPRASELSQEAAPANRAAELARCLEPLLQTLPEPYREAVAMTDLGGKTQREAAQRLGLTVSGMKARVLRGRKRLKTVLENCCEIELDRLNGVIDYQKRDPWACGGGKNN